MNHYEDLTARCLARFEEGGRPTVLEVAELLMDLPTVAMHCQEHHFIVPASLLTAAHMAVGAPRARLAADLAVAAERAGKVPGGLCGYFGCCGAAVGCGIFAAVLLETQPTKALHWDAVNRFTAKCLERVASVEGPRCCKRVTYLALSAATEFSDTLAGVALETPGPIVCAWHLKNKECRGTACPYFPGGKEHVC